MLKRMTNESYFKWLSCEYEIPKKLQFVVCWNTVGLLTSLKVTAKEEIPAWRTMRRNYCENVTICFTLIGAKESHEMVASRHIDCRVNWGPTMDQEGKILPTPNFFWSVLKTL